MRLKIIALAGVLACAGVCPAVADTQPGVHAIAAQPPTAETLSVRLTANHRTVRRGATIAFAIKVTNRGQTDAEQVTICDQLSPTVSQVIRSGGLGLFDATACRTVRSVTAGASVAARLLVRIGRHARLGCARNTARVIWSDHRASTSVTYRVTQS
jgi:uncharacterized repeat protein (TIGR01451 family)